MSGPIQLDLVSSGGGAPGKSSRENVNESRALRGEPPLSVTEYEVWLRSAAVPTSWEDFQSSPFTDLMDGAVVSFAAVDYVRDRMVDISGLPTGAGWSPYGRLSVLHFGAVGDGVHDDTNAFIAVNTYGKSVELPHPPVKYSLNDWIFLTVPVTVSGEGNWADLTDGERLRWSGAFWPDKGNARIDRITGRLFIGDKSMQASGNLEGTQGGIVPWAQEGANWASRDSTLFVIQSCGLIGAGALVSNQDQISGEGYPGEAIAVAGFAINTGSAPAQSAWGMYSDVQHDNPAGWSAGLEIAVKNKGGDFQSHPYYEANGTYGLWLAAGGDPSYGGEPENPSNTAVAIVKNGESWNKGIVFSNDAITGTDGSAGSNTWGNAVELARNHRIAWYEPTNNGVGFAIHSAVTNRAGSFYLNASNSNFILQNGVSHKPFMRVFDAGEGMSDFMSVANGAGYFVISAEGDSPNIDIAFTPKGSGRMKFGTHQASADAQITGFITIVDSSGVARKLAVIS